MQVEHGPLERVLSRLFQDTADPSELISTVLTEPITLKVVEKFNRHYLYVTDEVHTIMAIFPGKREELTRYPLQRPGNTFYTFDEKTHMYLNFEGSNIEPATHPYNPHFFLGDRFEDFLTHRRGFKCGQNEVYEVQAWRVGLTNVNRSGYYAPVLIL